MLLLRRVLFCALRLRACARAAISALRADAIGIDVKRVQWAAFVIAGPRRGLAGGLYAFSKGSISPESISVGRSIDGLVMVLLGGIQTLAGPIVGAVSFHTLHDTVMRQTEYWRAMLGVIILVLVLAVSRRGLRALRFRRLPARVRMQGMSVLEIIDLARRFGGVRAVDGVSFELAAGELLALIGPNGAGKSTCFNMINGQLSPIADRSCSTARISSAESRARSGGWASGAPSRSPTPSPR